MQFAPCKIATVLLALPLFSTLVSCAARPEMARLSMECNYGIDLAYRELDYSASKGLNGTISWMKAASLLTAAKTQQQFEKYPNCIDKVQRARFYISQSQQ